MPMSLYTLQRETGHALYRQIAQHLERDVLNQYAPGDMLPSENEMADRFGVNRHTLRRAIDLLVADGLLERQHGRGVFVINNQIDYPLSSDTRFTENLTAMGASTGGRVVRKQVLPAIERVAERLAIAVGEPVIWIESVRTVDGSPFCIISHFLPEARFGKVRDEYEGGSLHGFLAEHYGYSLKRVQSLVTAMLPQGDDAGLLAMPRTQPVLRVKSTNVHERDLTPLEYVITRFRADRIQLCINP